MYEKYNSLLENTSEEYCKDFNTTQPSLYYFIRLH